MSEPAQAATPPIAVSILNYQRKDELRGAIESVLAQDLEGIEILVVDNASTDGSAEMVRADYPQVQLIALDENFGTVARNRGLQAARADIVVTIDNDVRLVGADALRRTLELFADAPKLVCANFKIFDLEGKLSTRDWCHPRDWRDAAEQRFETDYVLEGASAIRRQAFLDVGGYWEALFIGHEGKDLALRLLDAGGELHYCPSVAVTHLASLDARPGERIYYTFTRNALWVSLRNHRASRAALHIATHVGMMAIAALRAGHFAAFWRGLRDGVAGFAEVRALRRPIQRETYRRIAEIRRQAPSVFSKVRRHLLERPI